jgi:hypothetical protein
MVQVRARITSKRSCTGFTVDCDEDIRDIDYNNVLDFVAEGNDQTCSTEGI